MEFSAASEQLAENCSSTTTASVPFLCGDSYVSALPDAPSFQSTQNGDSNQPGETSAAIPSAGLSGTDRIDPFASDKDTVDGNDEFTIYAHQTLRTFRTAFACKDTALNNSESYT
jgi:hypothetical protein